MSLTQEILDELRAIRLLLERQDKPQVSIDRRMELKSLAKRIHQEEMGKVNGRS